MGKKCERQFLLHAFHTLCAHLQTHTFLGGRYCLLLSWLDEVAIVLFSHTHKFHVLCHLRSPSFFSVLPNRHSKHTHTHTFTAEPPQCLAKNGRPWHISSGRAAKKVKFPNWRWKVKTVRWRIMINIIMGKSTKKKKYLPCHSMTWRTFFRQKEKLPTLARNKERKK